jgi:hypothetical protein
MLANSIFASVPARPGLRHDKSTAPKLLESWWATVNRRRSEVLSMLEPVEIGRAMKCGSGFDVAIKHRVSHTENRSHHRFGSFVPDVTVIFDNTGIDFHVPIRHVHVAHTFYLPKIQFATCRIQSENLGRKIVFQIRLQGMMPLR